MATGMQKNQPKSALGKGLGSLIPDSAVPAQESFGENKDRHPGVSLAKLKDIQVNQFQPRTEFYDDTLQELAQSIRENGVIQPLVVRKTADGYQLIAGERRLRAAKIAGLEVVPVVIRRSTDREALELALIENIQREDLNGVDVARSYQQLMTEFSLTQEQVSVKVGKDRASVANYLRILQLPEMIQKLIKDQILSFGHAKAIMGVRGADLQIRLAEKIRDQGLSVREAEQIAQDIKKQSLVSGQTSEAPEKSKLIKRLEALSQDLTHWVGARVVIKGNSKKGKLLVHYDSKEELERIVSRFEKTVAK